MKKIIYILLTVVLITGSCSKDIDTPQITYPTHIHEIRPGWDKEFSEYICKISSMHILEFKSFKELNEVADFIATEIYNKETVNSEDLKVMYRKYSQYTHYDYNKFYDHLGIGFVDFYRKHPNPIYYFPSLNSFYSEINKSFGETKQLTKEKADSIRLRYSYFFLFNDKDLISVKPHIAMKNKNHAYVVNIYGRVIVGGIEYNLNDCISFDELGI